MVSAGRSFLRGHGVSARSLRRTGEGAGSRPVRRSPLATGSSRVVSPVAVGVPQGEADLLIRVLPGHGRCSFLPGAASRKTRAASGSGSGVKTSPSARRESHQANESCLSPDRLSMCLSTSRILATSLGSVRSITAACASGFARLKPPSLPALPPAGSARRRRSPAPRPPTASATSAA